jgi:hypothetical protein
MESLGILHNEYNRQLHETAHKSGKATRRQHGHMHTLSKPGMDVERLAILDEKWAWIPPLVVANENDVLEGLESISLEELDAAFDQLSEETIDDHEGDGLDSGVEVDQVYDIFELEKVWNGDIPRGEEDEATIHAEKGASTEK